MGRALLGVMAMVLLAAVAAGGPPQEGAMLHVRKVADGDYRYVPAEVDVHAGSTVVLGHIFARHSLTSPDGLFNSTGDAGAWPTVVAPDRPGSYPFYCWLHADAATLPAEGMAGVLRVHARNGDVPSPTPGGDRPTGAAAASPDPPAAVPGAGVALAAAGAALASRALRRR
jgi:plastocyanin